MARARTEVYSINRRSIQRNKPKCFQVKMLPDDTEIQSKCNVLAMLIHKSCKLVLDFKNLFTNLLFVAPEK